jgi:outer membrane murein-binding lipoprotein Lpp
MRILRIASITSGLVFLSITPAIADTVNYSDTTKPVIESITLNPSVVNVSTEGAVLIATIVASDDLNNMISFEGHLMPLYGANPQTSSNQALSTKVVAGRVQVTFQLKYVFKKGTPVGDYQIRATVYDAADNRLIGAGANMPGNSFKVVNDVASAPIDVTQFDYAAKLQQYATQIQTLTAEIATARNKATQSDQYAAQVQSLTAELATSKAKTTQIEKQLADLNSKLGTNKTDNEAATSTVISQMQVLQTKFTSLEKKLKTICLKKPKPKGC